MRSLVRRFVGALPGCAGQIEVAAECPCAVEDTQPLLRYGLHRGNAPPLREQAALLPVAGDDDVGAVFTTASMPKEGELRRVDAVLDHAGDAAANTDDKPHRGAVRAGAA